MAFVRAAVALATIAATIPAPILLLALRSFFFFFFMNGNTERAQCALSQVCIP